MSSVSPGSYFLRIHGFNPSAIQVGLDRIFGFVAMIMGLAILATIPVLQFISLGYLLEVSARIARSGRLRDAFPGLSRAARVGRMGFAGAALFVPWIILRHLRNSAYLLGSEESARGYSLAMLLYGLFAGSYWYWASYRGARLMHFLWPAPLTFIRHLGDGPAIVSACRQVLNAFREIPWGMYFLQGLRGFVIGLLWLAIPTGFLVLAACMHPEPGFLVAIIGILFLAYVAGYLPFLQLRAVDSRSWRDGMDRRRVRDDFRRAPIAFTLAILLTLAAAVPLYLLKAESIPRESYWITSAIFIFTALPARVLQGWALSRSTNRGCEAHPLVVWGMRLLLIPVTILYALVVFLTQYTSWHGVWSLYEQHAFLLPIPFMAS